MLRDRKRDTFTIRTRPLRPLKHPLSPVLAGVAPDVRRTGRVTTARKTRRRNRGNFLWRLNRHITEPPQFVCSAGSIPGLSTMAPYDFNAPDADAILRSSDGKELRVHKLVLSLASPVYRGMFSLPQPIDPPSQIPSVDVSEPSDILQPFIQYLYPRSPPKISDISIWAALYTIADKYGAEGAMESLRDMLVPRFLDTHPLRVYALASRWGFEEEARIASRRTLTIDILKDFPREDAELMGGGACQQLYLLHLDRREAARTLVVNHPLPFSTDSSCKCPPPGYSGLVPSLSQRVGLRPWLTAEELYEEAARWVYPTRCNEHCRNAFNNMDV